MKIYTYIMKTWAGKADAVTLQMGRHEVGRTSDWERITEAQVSQVLYAKPEKPEEGHRFEWSISESQFDCYSLT